MTDLLTKCNGEKPEVIPFMVKSVKSRVLISDSLESANFRIFLFFTLIKGLTTHLLLMY